MTEDLCRANFEGWMKTCPGFANYWLDINGENYRWEATLNEWTVWQAAWNTRAEMENINEN